MKKGAAEASVQNVLNIVKQQGGEPQPITDGEHLSISILRREKSFDTAHLKKLADVADVIDVTKPYKLASREVKKENSRIKVGGVTFGGSGMPVIAGPCAIESELQALTIARSVKKAGAEIFRGGAFKPRTSPYSFQGLGEEGLKILARVREETGLPVVTEVMDAETFDMVEAYADMVQIGTRNMRNFSLLKRAGRSGKPILLKRAMSATLKEWLMAAEYIMIGGNAQVVLCERGVRTFVTHSRNTMDLAVIPAAKKESHLPIIADPSHAAGVREFVAHLALAATAGGADGLMIEVHHDPDLAWSDGPQSLYPDQFAHCMETIRKVHGCIRKSSETCDTIQEEIWESA